MESNTQLALTLQELLIKKGKTVAFAESCTGGFLSHLMTSNAGSSQCFLGSLVTYSNSLKQKILKVRAETLIQYGAVSQETVEAMLLGVFAVTGADYAISVSGVAGPDGGTEKTPVGTVWIAVSEFGKLPDVRVFHFSGDRRSIIAQSSYQSLSILLSLLIN